MTPLFLNSPAFTGLFPHLVSPSHPTIVGNPMNDIIYLNKYLFFTNFSPDFSTVRAFSKIINSMVHGGVVHSFDADVVKDGAEL